MVLVRLRGMSFAEKAKRVVTVFEEYGGGLERSFVVVANGGVRFRDA